MDWLTEIFRNNQVIPIFLTLGLGFWLGGLKFKSFSLGPVTATLIVGVIIGQLGIPISDTVKSLAFMLFLFAIGYSVGPQFFRSLKGDGLKQICFALVDYGDFTPDPGQIVANRPVSFRAYKVEADFLR